MIPPLFRRLLGDAMDGLPPALRAVHDSRDDQRWEGTAEVVVSRNPVARLLCRMMRLPAEGQNIPVTVLFERTSEGERWRRTFAGRSYQGDFVARDNGVIEHMGATTNFFRVSVEEGELRLDLEAFRFLGVFFPSWLRPHCHAREREEAGHFVFDVPITIPWLGFVIRYTGHMERRHG